MLMLCQVLTSTSEALPAEIPQDVENKTQGLKSCDTKSEASRHFKPWELHRWSVSMKQKMARRRQNRAVA